MRPNPAIRQNVKTPASARLPHGSWCSSGSSESHRDMACDGVRRRRVFIVLVAPTLQPKIERRYGAPLHARAVGTPSFAPERHRRRRKHPTPMGRAQPIAEHRVEPCLRLNPAIPPQAPAHRAPTTAAPPRSTPSPTRAQSSTRALAPNHPERCTATPTHQGGPNASLSAVARGRPR